MTTHIDATNSFVYNLKRVLKEGNTVVVRGMETKELTSQSITLYEPRRRCYIVPKRLDNIFAKIAEVWWMFAGRDDIEWLSHYLPRAPEFSDDGKTWRGAYGPRLRQYPPHNDWAPEIDQFRYVVDLLTRDPLSRQAVMIIWSPAIDEEPGKDVPCNNWIHFFIREEQEPAVTLIPGVTGTSQDPRQMKTVRRLHMNVAQRSCDILWGYSGIDTFSWSILHEMMANWLNCEVGKFTHFISSLHLYDKHYERAEDIIYHFPNKTVYDFGIQPVSIDIQTINDFDAYSANVFVSENMIRHGTFDFYEYSIEEKHYPQFVFTSVQMLAIYNRYVEAMHTDDPWDEDMETLGEMINLMPMCDFRIAAIEFFARRNPEFIDFVELEDNERRCLEVLVPNR